MSYLLTYTRAVLSTAPLTPCLSNPLSAAVKGSNLPWHPFNIASHCNSPLAEFKGKETAAPLTLCLYTHPLQRSRVQHASTSFGSASHSL